MKRSRPATLISVASTLFFIGGAILLGATAATLLEAKLYGNRAKQEVEKFASARKAHAAAGGADEREGSPPGQGELIGWMEIPRLGLSAAISEGSDRKTLLRSVGHIEGTALPGGEGNVGLAGHRDTQFRGLRNIAAGDDVHITTRDGRFDYVVDTTMVVKPDAVQVLNSSRTPALTLVTCYPFSYVGSAPKRFIVHATLLPSPAQFSSVALAP